MAGGGAPSSSSSPYFSLFLRAFGFKPGFRRTGPSRLWNIFVAAGVGVVSGHYIFSKPLEEYWTEQHRLSSSPEEEGEAQSGGVAEQKSPANNAKETASLVRK